MGKKPIKDVFASVFTQIKSKQKINLSMEENGEQTKKLQQNNALIPTRKTIFHIHRKRQNTGVTNKDVFT